MALIDSSSALRNLIDAHITIDEDTDSTNEYNTGFLVANDSLIIVDNGDSLKVATKFVDVTKRYFAEQGRQIDIIKLYGGMELAPIVGLADLIVDIVDTGKTLVANGLEPRDHMAYISSRLVVGKAAMKVKHAQIQPIIDQMSAAVDRQESQRQQEQQ